MMTLWNEENMPSKTLPGGIARKVKSVIANDDVNGMHLLIASGVVNADTVVGGVSLLGLAVRFESRALMQMLDQMHWGMGVRSVSVGNNDGMADRGTGHHLAVRGDGSIWGWGYNEYGQVGDGTVTEYVSPIRIIPEWDDVTALVAGGYHSLALRADGSLWSWGWNETGQLGDVTPKRRSVPARVMTGVRSVAVGGWHSHAIQDDGSLWTWGTNHCGQVGDGTTNDRNSPARVLTGVLDIATGGGLDGGNHSLAIRDDGTVWGWGENESGQLGDGTTQNRHTPSRVFSGFNDVRAVATGESHSLVLRDDGTLLAVGGNYYGQLGDGTNSGATAPVAVLSDVKTVSAREYCSAAVRHDGTLWTWGKYQRGLKPTKILDGVYDVRVIPESKIYVAREDGLFWPIH